MILPVALVNIWLYYKEKLTKERIVLKGSLVRIRQAVPGCLPAPWPSVSPKVVLQL